MQGPSRKAGWISPVSDEANFLGHYVGPIVADVISCFDDEDPMCGFVARAARFADLSFPRAHFSAQTLLRTTTAARGRLSSISQTHFDRNSAGAPPQPEKLRLPDILVGAGVLHA
jgi:hypothetical protein